MTSLLIARDVVKEAFAGRFMIGLFSIIALFTLLLTFSLDLEVVDGALAASRLFGKAMDNRIVPVDVALRPLFQVLTWVSFYFGLLAGVVATADIAPRMLSPGRVEFLLALPVRRVELVVGTFLGVLGIASVASAFAVGGVSVVLFAKARFFVSAPLVGGTLAVIGFCAVYAVMLAVGAASRSPALSAGAGLLTYIAGIAVSEKAWLLAWIRSPITRGVVDVVTLPIPNLRALAELGDLAASGEATSWGMLLPVLASTLAFAGFAVVVAAAIVQSRDY